MVQRHSGIVNMDWEVDHKADYLIVRHKRCTRLAIAFASADTCCS